MPEQQIIWDEVVTTITETQPLQQFIEQKKQELEQAEMEIARWIEWKRNILQQLDALISNSNTNANQ